MLVLLSLLLHPDFYLDVALHLFTDLSHKQHATQDSEAHDADVDDQDGREVVLVDADFAFRVNVHRQLDLALPVVIHTIEVAKEDIAEDKELHVANHIGCLDDSEDAATVEFWIEVRRINQV